MKLKKSESHRRDKKSSKQGTLPSSSSALSPKEAEWGLLSKENPVDPATIVPPQTSYHNTTNNNKRGNWGGVFGFGRNNHNRGEDSRGNKKSKSKKTLGYTISRTPKSTKDSSSSSQPSPQSEASTQLDVRSTHSQSQSQPQSQSKVKRKSSSKASQSKRKQTQAQSQATTQPVASSLSPPTPQKELFSDTEWMPNPVFFDDIIEPGRAVRDTNKTSTAGGSPQKQEQCPARTSPVKVADSSTAHPGFEVFYENDADASRLTATTVATTTVTSLSTSSSHHSPDKHTTAANPASQSPAIQHASSPQTGPQKTPSPTASSISFGSKKHRSPSVATPTSKSKKQHKQKSPSVAVTPSSASKKKEKSPSSSASKKQRHQSPVAHAAAKALVAQSQDDKDDDFGANDFDPNEASSSDDVSESDDDGETEFTGSAGPFTIGSQDSSSAFQFNLADKNMKSASTAHMQQPSTPATDTGNDEDGFRILKTRSSCSKLGKSPKGILSQHTGMSSLTPSSNAHLPAVSILPSSDSKQKEPNISATASVISQHTSGSSTLFPSSSIASSPSSVTVANSKGGSQLSSSDKQQQAKLILSRPFGRNSLPANVMPWVVQVAPAEWDNPERRWKYRIQVTKRQPSAAQPPTPSSSVAVTWRSLENFAWLEHALNVEFQGGLLLPLLNIAVGMTDLEQATHEVDADLLRNWLNDVLNGIRGQGELILGPKSVDMLQSEAVEAFLYRSTAPLQKPGNLITSMMGEAFVMKQELQKRQREHEQQQQQSRQNHRTTACNYEDTEVEGSNCQSALCKLSPRSRHPASPSTIQSRHQPDEPDSFVKNFSLKGTLSLLTDELCVSLGCQGLDDSPSSTGSSISSPENHKKRFARYTCSSTALGRADTLDIQDSFVDASTIASMQSSMTPANNPKQLQQNALASAKAHGKPKPGPWKLAQSTTLIQAERDLVLSYRKTALSAMEKVQILLEEEENIGLAWKRFGVAVSNLFSYEKEVESARLGEKKIHRDCMPYRKIKKSTVDQCVRALAQQKIDRSVPALRMLRSMLTAYVADLSAVGPSVEAYLEGMKQIAEFEEYFSTENQQDREDKPLKDGSVATDSSSSQTSSDGGADKELKTASSLFGSIQRHIRSLTSQSRDGEEKKANDHEADIIRTSSTSSTSTTNEDNEAPSSELLQKRRVEDRVLANERLLRESLTTLCKSTPMRTARMAYAYFKSEANQCRLLRSAAAALRSKTDLSVKEAVAQMVVRHQAENKEDMKTELALAQRMVNLGNKKKYPLAGNGADEAGSLTTEDQEQANAFMRDHALQIARERVGRWNSDFAMAIMKAVGVEDPNVRVEQTTRELRLVRKYAIGLRENLNRCIESVDILRKAVQKGGRQDLKGVDTRKKPAKHISDTRKEYFAEIAKLFSGVVMEDESGSPKNRLALPSTKTLSKAGIYLNDPMGWSSPFIELSSKVATDGKGQGECGDLAKGYIEGRDSQTDWLLSSLSGLLNDYTQRVEVVESFVYMECVGVQLEKHFSQKRTEALSAFEKKTDVTTAINIATRKRIPGLVEELKAKLGRFGSDVTHTSVKEAKEAHLESKSIKTELHDLALRRLQRARETSTERVIDLLKVWMKEEESACISELNAVGEILECLESNFLRALGC